MITKTEQKTKLTLGMKAGLIDAIKATQVECLEDGHLDLGDFYDCVYNAFLDVAITAGLAAMEAEGAPNDARPGSLMYHVRMVALAKMKHADSGVSSEVRDAEAFARLARAERQFAKSFTEELF